MTEPPCLAALRGQQDPPTPAALEAIQRLTGIVPSVRCHAADEPARLTARFLTSLLARIFPTIHLDVMDSGFEAVLREDAHLTHPDVIIVNSGLNSTRIGVGEVLEGAYTVAARGWRVFVASPGEVDAVPLPQDGPNPASALLASVLVSARLVNDIPDVVEAARTSGPTELNLWHPDMGLDGPTLPAEIALDVHGFGHGSISDGLWGALATWPGLRGRLVVVDPEHYEAHNRARYAFLEHDRLGTRKVAALRDKLAHHEALSVEAVDETVQDWRKTDGDRPSLALITPDNRVASAWAADTLPIRAIAASASDREAQVSLCDEASSICSYCLYSQPDSPHGGRRPAISNLTGLPLEVVTHLTPEWMSKPPVTLDEATVRSIEKGMNHTEGDLDSWIGKQLIEMLKPLEAQLYSAAVVQSDGVDRVVLPVPFASAAAGALALGALLRMTLADIHLEESAFNHIRLDVWSGKLSFQQHTRPGDLTCLCQHPARREWRS